MARRSRKVTQGSGWIVTRACPRCGRRDDECACACASPQADNALRATKPIARLRIEKRRGKSVTVAAIEGSSADEARALARELRTRCATGGSVTADSSGGEIELQGEHRERVRALLAERGYVVKG